MSLQIHHVLNRVVPDMARGFTIQTAYGDLTVEPGQLAERIREMVQHHAAIELARLDAEAAEAAEAAEVATHG